MIPFDTLSKARYHIVAGTAGNKILFVGGLYIVPRCWYDSSDGGFGWLDCRNESTRVDIYDTSTHSWSTHELARYYYGSMPVVTVGNKIFFSGGIDTAGRIWSKKVDIYDASTNSWSTSELSEARINLAVGTLGNKVFFAGGLKYVGFQNSVVSNKIDIYDVSSNSWTTATLSEARCGPTATSVGNKLLFGGGDYFRWSVSARVDIYDGSTNTWSTASLSEARSGTAAVTLGDKAFFVGGITGFATGPSHKVDIYDNTTGNWSVNEVNILGSNVDVVALNNKFLLLTGKYGNIYNRLTNSWSPALLDKQIGDPAIIAVGNRVYFAGGSVSYADGNQTNKVWTLQF